jgi:hypothetical protein
MCRKKFQKCWPHRLQDYSVWNEKIAFFTPYKTNQQTLNPLGLKFFAQHKVETLDIVLWNWVENTWKLIKP